MLSRWRGTDHARIRGRSQATEVLMKRWWILLLTLGLFAPIMGCEIDADADDDDARLEVDVDD